MIRKKEIATIYPFVQDLFHFHNIYKCFKKMRLQPNIFLRIFMFTAILPLWREFNRVPLDYALVKTFWPSKFGFDSNHSNWAQIHSLTFLQWKANKMWVLQRGGKMKDSIIIWQEVGQKEHQNVITFIFEP